MIDYSKEFEAIVQAYEKSGGDGKQLLDKAFASLVVSGNKILATNSISGVQIESEDIEGGIRARIWVEPGTQVRFPVHLCFGMVPKSGVQRIQAEYVIGDGASVSFLAHCSFPNAIEIQHLMDAVVRVGKNAFLSYSETHFHGQDGGIEVIPKTVVHVEAGGRFQTEFKLVNGRVGKLDLDYLSEVGAGAICEMETKVYGRADDKIRVKETIHLNGREARGLAKSRIVVSERAESEVLGEIAGNAPHARGHVDCMEIIKGQKARASAVPKLLVVDETAKLTHEAAIGSVDKKQVETLLARGLSENEAVDVIVKGLLR
jgi:Fe-S cluster assembly scaffold protein SufB